MYKTYWDQIELDPQSGKIKSDQNWIYFFKVNNYK